MSDVIDYYFTAPSPYAYLGHHTLMNIAAKHGKAVNFKPFDIMGVWGESGAVPPGQRPLVRQRYRLVDMQRSAVMRDAAMNAEPAFFPTNPTPADLSICALVSSGADPANYAYSLGKAIWAQEKQIADVTVLHELLTECGHDAEAILALSQSDEIAAVREKNTKEAIENDAVGAPAYVYNGEVFWGQDRLEYLEQMIESGRPAFT